MRELLITDAPAATVLVRVMTGSVFLSEGIQKFLYPADLAAGRFAKIGIPSPEIMGPFCRRMRSPRGALLIVGFLTRFAAILLLIDRFDQKFPCFSVTALGIFADEAVAIWFLEHDARGAD